jgi:hypothetical protein
VRGQKQAHWEKPIKEAKVSDGPYSHQKRSRMRRRRQQREEEEEKVKWPQFPHTIQVRCKS